MNDEQTKEVAQDKPKTRSKFPRHKGVEVREEIKKTITKAYRFTVADLRKAFRLPPDAVMMFETHGDSTGPEINWICSPLPEYVRVIANVTEVR